MMVSRLFREKGASTFLALAASLADQAHFVHVGRSSHDQRDALTAADVAAASGSVEFIGAVE